MTTAWEKELIEYMGLSDDSPTGLVWLKRPAHNSRAKEGGPAVTAQDPDGYYISNFRGKNVKAHRIVFFLAYGYWPVVVDHKDGDRKNNRPDNLREVTVQDNSYNRYRRCKGYRWHTGKRKFEVRISAEKKRYTIGYFDTETEARAAYLNAKKLLHPSVPECFWEVNGGE